jgi:hypothetical protein
MSQTIVPTAPAGGPSSAAPDGPAGGQPAAATLQARVAAASEALRHALSGTPGKLRVVSGLAVLAAVLVAIGGGAALNERSAALDEASATTAHLVLVQRVQTDLVQADADATNSFLSFGLEPPAQRSEYLTSIQAASHDLAVAAKASSADAAALGDANAALASYTSYVASARANNLQGLPVGASFLKTASDLMTTGIVPQLQVRSTADLVKINSAYSRASHAGWWLALVALVGIGALVWAQVYLARHSRRIINLPLAASTVAVLVALIAAAGAMAVAQSKANDVRHGALAQATALSQSRVAAFNAKSIESLTLVNRGSGLTLEPTWKAAMSKATKALQAGDDSKAVTALDGYAAAHKQIRDLDDKHQWQEARRKAIATTHVSGSANAYFASYADTTEKALQAQAAATTSGLNKAGNALLPAGILVVLLGLLAAVSAWWGVTLRLDEYR